MDYEVVSRPCKFVIGCWTRPGTTSVYTKKKWLMWPHSLRSPKDIFQGLQYPLHGPTSFAVGKAKEPYIIFFLFFQNYPFWTCGWKKTSTLTFLVHGYSSWSTFGLHLVRGPNTLYIDFWRNRIIEVGQSSRTMEKAIFHGPTSCSMM
jgi:hypothetical protein